MTRAVAAMNFRRVTPFLYRGGLPSEEDVAALKDLGIKTILDFNRLAHPREKKAAEAAGLLYIHLPWTAHWHRYLSFAYYPEITRRFLEVVAREEYHPIYVHCFHGRDRTGMLIAAYRIAVENWPLQAALAEMRAFGFNPWWHLHIVLFLKGFAARHGKA